MEKRQFWITLGLISILPISFFRTLDNLKFTSSLSLMLIFGMGAIIIMYAESSWMNPCYEQQAFVNETIISSTDTRIIVDHPAILKCKGDTVLETDLATTMKSLSIYVFSFTCHQNIFAVFNEIDNRSQKRIDGVIAGALGWALLLYFLVAIEGYRTYGSNVKPDIIQSYPLTLVVTIMRILIAVMVLLTYPLQLDPGRRCISSLVHSILSPIKSNIDVDDDNDDDMLELVEVKTEGASCNGGEGAGTLPISAYKKEILAESELLKKTIDDLLFTGITCLFLLLSYCIAMVVDNLGIVLALVGATGSTAVTYILPGIIYVKLHTGMSFLKVMAYLQVIVGLCVIPLALYFIFKFGGDEVA